MIAGTDTREIDAMVPAGVSGAARGFGVSGWQRKVSGTSSLPDSHAAPVRPMILVVVNAVDAIVMILLINV